MFVQQKQRVPGAPEMESGKYEGADSGGVIGHRIVAGGQGSVGSSRSCGSGSEICCYTTLPSAPSRAP